MCGIFSLGTRFRIVPLKLLIHLPSWIVMSPEELRFKRSALA